MADKGSPSSLTSSPISLALYLELTLYCGPLPARKYLTVFFEYGLDGFKAAFVSEGLGDIPPSAAASAM